MRPRRALRGGAERLPLRWIHLIGFEDSEDAYRRRSARGFAMRIALRRTSGGGSEAPQFLDLVDCPPRP